MSADCRIPPAVRSRKKNPENLYQEISSVDPYAPPLPPKRSQLLLPGNSATLPRPRPTVPVLPPKPLPLPRSRSQEELYEVMHGSQNGSNVRLHRAQSLWLESQSSTVNKCSIIGDVRPVYLSESMSMSRLVEKYSKAFPIRIAITTGYLGPTPRLTLSSGDAFNIHFQKRTKVVVIRDSQDAPYSVPLNSVLQFGLIQKNIVKSRGGLSPDSLVFEKVADVLALSKLPRVIAATVSWRGENEKSSVECTEILIVKQALKSKIIMHRGRKSLKVFSVLSRSEKILPEDCIGRFTINSNRVLLHLPDLMEHIPNLFPSEAIMYCDYRSEGKLKDLPPGFLSRNITMCEYITEASLVASSVKISKKLGEVGYHPDSEALVDIPVDDEALKIEVAVIDSSDSQETEKLYEDTRHIYERFNPRKLKSFKDTGSEKTYATQSLFYEAIRPGCENVGVELEEPSSVYDRLPAHSRLLAAAACSKATEMPVENVVPKQLPGSPLFRCDSTHSHNSVSSDVGSVSSGFLARSAVIPGNSAERLETEMKQNKEEIGKVRASLFQVTSQLKSLGGQIQELASLSKSSTTSVPATGAAGNNTAAADVESKEYLRSLDLLQVCAVADNTQSA